MSILQTLTENIGRFSQGRILVIGDLAIDEMIFGHSARLSREAPVLILRHSKTDVLLGAGANAAHNVAALGANRVCMIGVVGQDYQAEQIKTALTRDGVGTDGLIEDPDRPTTTKSRISGIANHSVTQQIVRIDRECDAPVSGKVENALLDKITRMLPQFDAILLSDYHLGVMTPAIIAHTLAMARQQNKPVAVDSQADLAQFQGATTLTPNQPEAERNVGFEFRSSADIEQAGAMLLKQTQAESVLITLGGQGMSLFQHVGDKLQRQDIPVFNKSDVFDVTGAGDTVVATLTLALATGSTLWESALLGNLAASIVVKRFGASVTHPQELISTLNQLPVALLQSIQHSNKM
jgi:rfaE bifunctional protein kinase chain/domain